MALMSMEGDATTQQREPEPDPMIGRTFGGYRVDELVGKGGMGEVYRATQLSLSRAVAIKVLPEALVEDTRFLDRFEREVDILSRLSHPNIVTVFERGTVDERPYLAMEYVRGTSLREVMKEGPVPPPEALAIVRAVLSALEHAHAQGIVHRDIKPENVLLAPGGIVKVADFGLSRLLHGEEDRTRLTRSFVALGTFEYMAPEQRGQAKDADARSDLYATGVVLYEMIAGELPIGHFDPLSKRRPRECDSRLDAIVERSLKTEPDHRFQEAAAMGEAVSALLLTPPPPPPPEEKPATPGAPQAAPASSAGAEASTPVMAVPLPGPALVPARKRGISSRGATLLLLGAAAAGTSCHLTLGADWAWAWLGLVPSVLWFLARLPRGPRMRTVAVLAATGLLLGFTVVVAAERSAWRRFERQRAHQLRETQRWLKNYVRITVAELNASVKFSMGARNTTIVKAREILNEREVQEWVRRHAQPHWMFPHGCSVRLDGARIQLTFDRRVTSTDRNYAGTIEPAQSRVAAAFARVLAQRLPDSVSRRFFYIPGFERKLKADPPPAKK